jgi:hypothetical protein
MIKIAIPDSEFGGKPIMSARRARYSPVHGNELFSRN